jgi:hypothetical protein
MGIRQQDYSLHENGREIKSISIFGMDLVEPVLESPHLSEIVADVIGVGFEPGRSEVRLKYNDRQLTVSATPLQVEQALELRHSKVRVLALISEAQCKLLRVQEAELPWSSPSRERAVFGRWDGLLRRLAQ